MAKKRRKRSIEFKPDPQTATWVKTFHLTIQQRLQLAKWALYILTIVLCLLNVFLFLGGDILSTIRRESTYWKTRRNFRNAMKK